jgi:hypothetical protein
MDDSPKDPTTAGLLYQFGAKEGKALAAYFAAASLYILNNCQAHWRRPKEIWKSKSCSRRFPTETTDGNAHNRA